ncbi:hypothetical protein DFH09DRAFT_1313781 [Mycena vulgaris]|nr:hypothetical protein DFH09DRAFT_1313781 [Mycena vulgaris]
MRPLPKRAKNAGKLAVEEVLRLRKVQAVLKARVEGLEEAITEDLAELVDVEMAERDLEVARKKLATSKATLRRKEVALGVDDRQVLRNLVTSGYIQARMNARALKYRLRHKLCSRKFELDWVEHTFHRKKMDPKLKTHIEDAVKRRDPRIQELVRNYNKLCAEMATLLRLDVDDEIWQDVGVDDAYNESEPPLWLKSEVVRDGTKGMLEQDRCNEEAPRLFMNQADRDHWLSRFDINAATDDGRIVLFTEDQLRLFSTQLLDAHCVGCNQPIAPFGCGEYLLHDGALGAYEEECKASWEYSRNNIRVFGQDGYPPACTCPPGSVAGEKINSGCKLHIVPAMTPVPPGITTVVRPKTYNETWDELKKCVDNCSNTMNATLAALRPVDSAIYDARYQILRAKVDTAVALKREFLNTPFEDFKLPPASPPPSAPHAHYIRPGEISLGCASLVRPGRNFTPKIPRGHVTTTRTRNLA